ncbi:MAG: alpha/beta fold hydrolase [Syntrophomonadaceae bacterium]
MKNELVRTETRDQVVLHGAYYESDARQPAVLIMHGAAMNFYTGVGRFLPEILASRGYPVLSVNNRGHDFGTAPDGDRSPVLGLMREKFTDCVLDLEAWIEFLAALGHPRVILVGHSQGIPKILYAQQQKRFPGVAGMVLISPPPSFAAMLRYLVSDNYYERGLFKARELAELGMNEQLIVLRGRGTMPWIFIPAAFLSFYGPETPADTAELIKDVLCPVLLVRGSQDFEPVSRELLERLQSNAGCGSAAEIAEIPGASHFYTHHEKELGATILQWLDKISGSADVTAR